MAKRAAPKAAPPKQGSGRRVITKDFFSEEMQSQYVKGLSYTSDNPKLDAELDKWLRNGSATLGGPAAEVRGR
jgi:hypothetical protein